MINVMENTQQFGYFARDVAMDLEVTTSTLRRWSIELEKNGYKFDRNEKDHRIYFERDFKAFRELKKLIGNSVPFLDAVQAVASMTVDNKNATKTPSVYQHEVRLSIRELQELVQGSVQKAIQQEKDNIIDEIQTKMNNVIEQRDRQITYEMRRSLEQKQLEHAANLEKENQLNWWQKIFRKKEL
ncbi:DNA-binding protein [Halobacillus litoralis]|nr:DNA-binding protein [Halobacillus litoralis]